jgi:hypothetical protein
VRTAGRTDGHAPGHDADRAALYAAEVAAFDGTDLEEALGLQVAAALAAAVTGSGWWSGPDVRVRAARSDARSSSCRSVEVASAGGCGGVEIRLAADQTTPATVAHELGHALAGPSRGHDATYRRALLDVIAVITNLDPTDRRHQLHAEQLLAAFDGAGLKVGEREWAVPPARVVGAIAL